MQNLTDTELDDLFKKAAADSEQQPAMPDWTDMQTRLQRLEDDGHLPSFKETFLGDLLLVTITGVLWLAIMGGKVDSSGSDKVSEQTPTLFPDRALTTDTFAIKALGEQSILLEGSNQNHLHRSGESSDQVQQHTVTKLANEQKAAQARSMMSRREGRGATLAERMDKRRESLLTTRVASVSIGGVDKTEVVGIKEALPVSSDSLPEIIKDEKNVDRAKREKEEEESKEKPGWRLRAMVSPDYSMVGSVDPRGMGYNAGLSVMIPLSKRFFVSVGAVRSNKVYSSYNLEYGNYKVDETDGECAMWDIPVMSYYYIVNNRSLSLYAGAGVSSYLMSRERYVHRVQSYYGEREYRQTVSNENNEWFAVMNFSVGVEKQISNRFSIQFEPYYKRSMTGIGAGDVSLSSFGTFINLQYHFNP
jgi:opacity protein-like surface antigen